MSPWEPTDEQIDEKLVELSYVWGDIEEEIDERSEAEDSEAAFLSDMIGRAFRVEATFERNQWDDPCTYYVLLYDVAERDAREAARDLVKHGIGLWGIVAERAQPWHTRDFLKVRSVPRDTPVVGKVCRRAGEKHPTSTAPVPEHGPTGLPEGAVELGRSDVAVAEEAEDGTPKPRVRREFQRSPELVTPASFPDWHLLGKIVSILSPYRDDDFPLGSFGVSVEDDRGRYEAPNLDALRKEFEERSSHAVASISVSVQGFDPEGSLYNYRVSMSPHREPFARLAGTDEITVNGIASRLVEIFREASKRQKPARSLQEPDRHPPELESLRERLLPPHRWTTWAELVLGVATLIVAIVAIFASR